MNKLSLPGKGFFFSASVGLVVLFISSCTTVKEYQKNKLNDAEMSLSGRKV